MTIRQCAWRASLAAALTIAHVPSLLAQGLPRRVRALEDQVAALDAALNGPPVVIPVDCGAGESVNAALATVTRGRARLEIAGTCPEDVTIAGLDDVWLTGLTGASLQSLQIESSRRIRVSNLTLTPTGFTGAVSVRRSECDLHGLSIDGGGISGAMSIDWNSDVLLGTTTVTNVRSGISLLRRSTVWIAGVLSLEGPFPTSPSDSSAGLFLGGGSQLTANLDGASSIRGFSNGIQANESSVSLFVASFAGSELTIDSHRNSGIVLVSSALSIAGSTRISGHLDPNGAGIFAVDGATVSLSNGVQLTNNTDGLLLQNNATARVVFDAQFDGNTRGVHVRNESVVYFAGALITFSANGTDVSCDEFSLSSRASLTDATTVACVNMN